MKSRRALAVLGTGSDVGKSIVTAAICRSIADRGVNFFDTYEYYLLQKSTGNCTNGR